jgi:hypothetical protein
MIEVTMVSLWADGERSYATNMFDPEKNEITGPNPEVRGSISFLVREYIFSETSDTVHEVCTMCHSKILVDGHCDCLD